MNYLLEHFFLIVCSIGRVTRNINTKHTYIIIGCHYAASSYVHQISTSSFFFFLLLIMIFWLLVIIFFSVVYCLSIVRLTTIDDYEAEDRRPTSCTKIEMCTVARSRMWMKNMWHGGAYAFQFSCYLSLPHLTWHMHCIFWGPRP